MSTSTPAPTLSRPRTVLRRSSQMWAHLIEPDASIQDPGTRRQVQLLSAFLLTLLSLIFLGALAGIAARGADISSGIQVVLLALLVITYRLSRTPRHQVAAVLTVLILSVTAFGSVLAGPERASVIIYSYLPIAFIVAGFLLSTRAASVIVVVNVVIIFCLPLVIPGYSFRAAGTDGGIMLSLGVIIIIFSVVRNLIERDRLAVLNQANAELRELRDSLEERVSQRTAQLRASADVGRAAASILDTNQLLREIVNLITDQFSFYYAAVFLADDTNQWAVLREATGEAGRTLKERKHQLEIGGQSMVGTAIKTRKARIALDVGNEAVRFANPLLPETRSEIALPLVVGTRGIGALDVQSTQMAAFDEASAAVLQSMADQIAIALSNTLQFQQAQAALQRTRQLYETSVALSNAADASSVLHEFMSRAVSDASAAQIFTYGPLDEAGQYAYLEVAAHWTKDDSTLTLPQGTRMPPQQMPLLSPLSTEPYLIRDAIDPLVAPEQQQIMQAMQMRALLGYALVAGSQPVGLLLIAYRDPHVFTPAETQPLQALTGQMAVTLRNQQLVREQLIARQQLDEINQRLTKQVWEQYLRTRGQSVRKIDVGAGVSQDSSTPALPSELSASILIHGQEIGLLRLEDATPDRQWTPNEKALIEAVAGEVAIAVENARLIEQTERRAQREARLNQIAQQLRQATDIGSILQTAAEQLSLALDTSHAQAQLGAAQPVARRRNGEQEVTPDKAT